MKRWLEAIGGTVMGTLVCMALPAGAAGQTTALVPVQAPPTLQPLASSVTGRAQRVPAGDAVAAVAFGAEAYATQWPAVYFDTAFRGRELYLGIGANPSHLRVVLDGAEPFDLVDEAPGAYRLGPLTAGPHHVRVEVVSESRGGPSVFEGFALPAGEKALALRKPARAIEFIGDSHTVGYGNAQVQPTCTPQEVWASTDSARAFGPRVAEHYGAAYEVNAISGRGVVRNYDGNPADTLPAAYPYRLFDKKQRVEDAAWQPEVIVVALGTNDFSTPLHAGERWPTREALHAAYERGYVNFLSGLRSAHPGALLVVWTTGSEGGEIETEAAKAVDAAKAAGIRRLVLVPVNGLAFSGCNNHPSLADDAVIAARLEEAIDAAPGAWQGW